jgi:hypothetical protein
MDLIRDICGEAPVSSLNYLFTTCILMSIFVRFEDVLKQGRNPLYLRAYDESERSKKKKKRQKHTDLVLMALAAGQDGEEEGEEECLRVMADIFQNHHPQLRQFVNLIYWPGLETTVYWARKSMEKDEDEDNISGDACSVM